MSVSPPFAAILAVLSTAGAYFIAKILLSLFCGSKEIAAMVLIKEKAQLDTVELSLADAAHALFYTKDRKLGLLVQSDLLQSLSPEEHARLNEAAALCGARVYIYQ